MLVSWRLSSQVLCAVLLASASACNSKDRPSSESPATQNSASAPTTTPIAGASSLKTFEDRSKGFRIQYPADWSVQQDPDYVLAVVPPDMKAGDPPRRVTADLPWLPPHLPGMITLGRMKDGYIKKQQKKLTDFKLVEDVAVSIPDAKAQRVIVSGKLNGQPRTLAALLVLHDEKVYVIRVDSDDGHYPLMKGVWDQVAGSLQWTK